MQGKSHHTICGVKSLLHSIAMMNIDVNVQNTIMISETKKQKRESDEEKSKEVELKPTIMNMRVLLLHSICWQSIVHDDEMNWTGKSMKVMEYAGVIVCIAMSNWRKSSLLKNGKNIRIVEVSFCLFDPFPPMYCFVL